MLQEVKLDWKAINSDKLHADIKASAAGALFAGISTLPPKNGSPAKIILLFLEGATAADFVITQGIVATHDPTVLTPYQQTLIEGKTNVAAFKEVIASALQQISTSQAEIAEETKPPDTLTGVWDILQRAFVRETQLLAQQEKIIKALDYLLLNLA